MSVEPPFGHDVRSRRRGWGLTQDELARRVGCAPITIRKIEHDEMRPSVQIAERLAMALEVALEERAAFVRLARLMRVSETATPLSAASPRFDGGAQAAPTPAPRRDEIGL